MTHVMTVVMLLISLYAFEQHREAESCTKDLTYELLDDNMNYNCTTDRDCELKTGTKYHDFND